MHDLIDDIMNWERFYLSGRLQKPVGRFTLFFCLFVVYTSNRFAHFLMAERQKNTLASIKLNQLLTPVRCSDIVSVLKLKGAYFCSFLLLFGLVTLLGQYTCGPDGG